VRGGGEEEPQKGSRPAPRKFELISAKEDVDAGQTSSALNDRYNGDKVSSETARGIAVLTWIITPPGEQLHERADSNPGPTRPPHPSRTTALSSSCSRSL
jgi:hypothetical protein